MFIKNWYYIRLDYAKLWNICEYLILHSVSVTFQRGTYCRASEFMFCTTEHRNEQRSLLCGFCPTGQGLDSLIWGIWHYQQFNTTVLLPLHSFLQLLFKDLESPCSKFYPCYFFLLLNIQRDKFSSLIFWLKH